MGFTKPKHAPCSVMLTKEQVSALRIIPMYGERDATPTRKLQFVDEPKKYQSLSKADVYKKVLDKTWKISNQNITKQSAPWRRLDGWQCILDED